MGLFDEGEGGRDEGVVVGGSGLREVVLDGGDDDGVEDEGSGSNSDGRGGSDWS